MTMKSKLTVVLLALLPWAAAYAASDEQRGAQVFQACAACHSLQAGQNLTGPSLSGVWGRKAGSLPDFPRYSDALKRSGIVWSKATLDAWIRDPHALVPGNFMTFPGIKEQQAREDLIAFLKQVSQPGSALAGKAHPLPNLKEAPARAVVKAIRHCKDTYYVTDGEGNTRPYWEFNLRFKTDSTESGPAPNKPVRVGQGMGGDRAQIVFSRPAEFSSFIKEGC